ncbi:MAG: hypothetical protein DRI84_08165 [Bacteroidetes bacterium]|nr:MAG: hypothetical protein DRI84_08165 [Bacteroidota bacterium]
MSNLGYLGDMAKRYDDDFLTALHSKTINIIRTCEVIGDIDIFNIADKIMDGVAGIFPVEEDIEKYAAVMIKTHSVVNKKRDIYREIATIKYNTLFPTEEQVDRVKHIPGRYGVEDDPSGSWDEYYYNVAVQAARNSKCLSRKIGAILVKDKAIISTGYNGPPRGIPTCDNRWYIDEQFNDKYGPKGRDETCDICPRYVLGAKSGELTEICVAAHAEENAVLACAREGISTKGAIMYMTCSIPCFRCMIKIINAGISELIMTGTKTYDYNTMYLLSNSDVKVRLYDFC